MHAIEQHLDKAVDFIRYECKEPVATSDNQVPPLPLPNPLACPGLALSIDRPPCRSGNPNPSVLAWPSPVY